MVSVCKTKKTLFKKKGGGMIPKIYNVHVISESKHYVAISIDFTLIFNKKLNFRSTHICIQNTFMWIFKGK